MVCFTSLLSAGLQSCIFFGTSHRKPYGQIWRTSPSARYFELRTSIMKGKGQNISSLTCNFMMYYAMAVRPEDFIDTLWDRRESIICPNGTSGSTFQQMALLFQLQTCRLYFRDFSINFTVATHSLILSMRFFPTFKPLTSFNSLLTSPSAPPPSAHFLNDEWGLTPRIVLLSASCLFGNFADTYRSDGGAATPLAERTSERL